MKLSNNPKVNDFLIDIQSVSADKLEIIESIREIFNAASPALVEGIKYGGLVFNLSNTLVGGIFPYKAHVTIEFSEGATLPDPSGILEGKGKKRRHLKIIEQQDIKRKNTGFFVKEAVKPGGKV